MYNRFSSNPNSKHGFDHSVISTVQSSNAVTIWDILKMTEKEYNAKYNPSIIPHSSPK